MNNKVKQALKHLTPRARKAYHAGLLPDRMAIAMSRLTTWEQEHMSYEPDPLDPNRSMRCGLWLDNGEPAEIPEDRKADIQTVIDIFLEDQLSVRVSNKLKRWSVS